jgi:putative DNA primase/helicase
MTATRVDAFRQEIEQAGLTPPATIIADGKLHRFASNGDHADDAGWYTYFSDEPQAGVFGCWRTGFKQTWSSKTDSTLTLVERERQRKRIDEVRHQREQDERLRHADAAERAQRLWDGATPAPATHPYLRRKQAQAHGLRTQCGDLIIAGQRVNGALIVPLHDVGGVLCSLEFITADGTKLFLPGGRKRGGAYLIGTVGDGLCIVEGFATGASVHQATGYAVAVAFDAGNLNGVAKSFREKYPNAMLIVCGDHDQNGTGQAKATEAAESVGGLVVLPETPGHDWNDVHIQRGLDAVQEAITTVIRREETRTMKTESLMNTTPEQLATEFLARYRHLLEGPDPIPAPRLPQDYREGLLSIGVMIEGKAYVIRSDREILSCEEFGAVNHGLTNVRFSKEGIKRFLQGEDMNGAALMERLEAFLRRFVVMGEDLPALLAIWLAGTYGYMMFEYFPYLVLRSPEKRCGKSRTLDLIALLGFNAHQPTASPTEAQIFREPREDGGVQIYDELEGMTGDKERWGAVTSVFNVGFHRGSVVSRYKKTGQGQQKETFDTYGPRAIASISSLEATLEDRSIMVMMQRLLPGQQTERFSLRRLDHEAQRLRDDLYILALTTAPTIAELYDGAEFAGLQGLDHRAVDLWEPVLSIAAVIDASGTSSDLTNRMARLAERLGGDRNSHSGDDTIPAIIETLNDCLLIGSEAKISTKDLVEKVRLRLGWDTLTPKALANRLHPLGLRTDRWREGGDLRRGYIVTRDQVDDLARRYIQETSGTWHK